MRSSAQFPRATRVPLTLLGCHVLQFTGTLVRKTTEYISNEVMTYIAAKSDVHISSLPQICLRFLIPPPDTTFRNDCVVLLHSHLSCLSSKRSPGDKVEQWLEVELPLPGHTPGVQAPLGQGQRSRGPSAV